MVKRKYLEPRRLATAQSGSPLLLRVTNRLQGAGLENDLAAAQALTAGRPRWSLPAAQSLAAGRPNGLAH